MMIVGGVCRRGHPRQGRRDCRDDKPVHPETSGALKHVFLRGQITRAADAVSQ